VVLANYDDQCSMRREKTGSDSGGIDVASGGEKRAVRQHRFDGRLERERERERERESERESEREQER
jgi:hypothetical protein